MHGHWQDIATLHHGLPCHLLLWWQCFLEPDSSCQANREHYRAGTKGEEEGKFLQRNFVLDLSDVVLAFRFGAPALPNLTQPKATAVRVRKARGAARPKSIVNSSTETYRGPI